MPNVTFYMPKGQMPSDERLSKLSRDCTELCTSVLEADLNNVHVIYVDVRQGHGHAAFAEVQYRLETFRTPAVMNRFMEALDDIILRSTGFTARIRCFGYAASNIHARN
ncbi:tautomerase family protein [Paraburkholderia sp. BCC1876]|uniref:tautomerase family protein n=1 Tax=Paraburkholderia sp. BCC1876 TaxID=2676303 RepID=UPI001590B34F|nr:tautomerase family protein [Paraburkholderia sp. BCC1876]